MPEKVDRINKLSLSKLNFNYQEGGPAPSPLPSRSEQEVMRTWLTQGEPVVSIICATYNHAAYLEDALRGFIGQVTSFPFEIIVRDDASSDGTADIVRNYAARYPTLIRAVLETENRFSQGIRPTPVLVNLARAPYLAICEGDDYWIISDKLEKQVQLLREHPQASMSVAKAVLCKYDEQQRLVCRELLQGKDKLLQEFEDIKINAFHTATFLIRTDLYREILTKHAKNITIGDYITKFLLVRAGPFVVLDEIVAVYRVTGKGMWTSRNPMAKMARLLEVSEEYYWCFYDDAVLRQFFGGNLYNYYRWMFSNGIWAFNNQSRLANLRHFMYFALKYGIARSAMVRWLDKPVQAMGFFLKRCLPDRSWKYLQSLWRKFRQ